MKYIYVSDISDEQFRIWIFYMNLKHFFYGNGLEISFCLMHVQEEIKKTKPCVC